MKQFLSVLALVMMSVPVQADDLGVNSFGTCLAAGGILMESAPLQCEMPDGRRFTKTDDIIGNILVDAQKKAKSSSRWETSLLYPFGVGRTFDVAPGRHQDFLSGVAAAQLFVYTVEGGRILLGGGTVGYANTFPWDDPKLLIDVTPIGVRVRRNVYVSVGIGKLRPQTQRSVSGHLAWCFKGCGRR